MTVLAGGGLIFSPEQLFQHGTAANAESEQDSTFPRALRIPSIGIDAPIVQIGLEENKEMESPKSPAYAGWYKYSALPGGNGTAVIAGHLDTSLGLPAIFWNLSKLTAGDRIEIDDKNGKTHVYLVTESHQYKNSNAPLEQIFASGSDSLLQLITCAGGWSWTNGTYEDRLVVTAKKAV